GADLAAETQWKARTEASVEAQTYRDRIPDRAERGAVHFAFYQPAQNGGVVGGRATASIVGWIRHHHRTAVECERGCDPCISCQVIRRGAATHGDEFLADLGCQTIRPRL